MEETKVKLLRVLQILEGTDQYSPMTSPQICEKLKFYGISAEKKSIRRDIYALIDAGYPIALSEDHKKGYYMKCHKFEEWEIKVMMDAVHQTRCISMEDTKTMCDKLLHQTSVRSAKRLNKIIMVSNATKCKTSKIANFISILIDAMSRQRKISFQYTDRDRNMKCILRKDGYTYQVNPYTVIWENGTYYLICNLDKYDSLTHFRLDRMENLQVVDKKQIRDAREFLGPNPDQIIQEHVNTIMHQFVGERIHLKLECSDIDMNILYDFAGENVRVVEKEDGKIIATLVIQESEGMLSWLMQHCTRIKVLSPERVKENLIRQMKEGLSAYQV